MFFTACYSIGSRVICLWGLKGWEKAQQLLWWINSVRNRFYDPLLRIVTSSLCHRFRADCFRPHFLWVVLRYPPIWKIGISNKSKGFRDPVIRNVYFSAKYNYCWNIVTCWIIFVINTSIKRYYCFTKRFYLWLTDTL